MNLKKILLSAVWVLCAAPCAFGADGIDNHVIKQKYNEGCVFFSQAQEAGDGKLEPALAGEAPDRVAYHKYRAAVFCLSPCYGAYPGGEKDFRPALMLAVAYAHLVSLANKFSTLEDEKECARLSGIWHQYACTLFREKYRNVFVGTYEGIDTFIGMEDADLNSRYGHFARHLAECKVNQEEFLTDFYFVYGHKTGRNQRNIFGATLTFDVATLRHSR